MRVASSILWGTVDDKLAVSELMALYRFTVIGLRWQAAQKKKHLLRFYIYNSLS